MFLEEQRKLGEEHRRKIAEEQERQRQAFDERLRTAEAAKKMKEVEEKKKCFEEDVRKWKGAGAGGLGGVRGVRTDCGELARAGRSRREYERDVRGGYAEVAGKQDKRAAHLRTAF